MTIYVRGPINRHMVNYIMTSYEQMKKKENLTIYFTSEGGEIGSMNVLIDFISQRGSNITMVFSDYIMSAGVHLALEVTCSKYILEGCSAMVHLPRLNVDINVNGTLSEGQKYADIWIKDKSNAKKWLDVYAPILTETELKKVKDGEDLYLSPKRLQKLIKDNHNLQISKNQ